MAIAGGPLGNCATAGGMGGNHVEIHCPHCGNELQLSPLKRGIEFTKHKLLELDRNEISPEDYIVFWAHICLRCSYIIDKVPG